MSIGLVPTLFLAFSGRIADISDILGGSVENRAGVECVGEVAVGAASRMQHCDKAALDTVAAAQRLWRGGKP